MISNMNKNIEGVFIFISVHIKADTVTQHKRDQYQLHL